MNNPANIAKPWYREPWPWILMAGPAVVIVAGVITAWLAIRSSDGLVDDDYYKQGLAVNQRMERDHQAATAGLSAEVVTGTDRRELRLFLNTRAGVTLPPKLVLRITHPTRAGFDQKIALESDASGFYIGRLAEPLAGRWHVSLEDEDRNWRITGDWNVDKQPSLRLPAAEQVSSNHHGG